LKKIFKQYKKYNKIVNLKNVKTKLTILIILNIFSILIFCNNVFAISTVDITLDKYSVIKGEEFEVYINLNEIPAASLTLELFFNTNKLEYVSGPENSNNIGSKIIYTWTDINGNSISKHNEKFITFKFKAKETGDAQFGLIGMFLDKNVNLIDTNLLGTKVNIFEKPFEQLNEDSDKESNVSEDSAKLKIMRTGIEGISPEFDSDINEYFLVLGEDIKFLNLEAIPENKDAVVKILNNSNLQKGLNNVQIEVISKNGKNKEIYNINITKTSEPEKANADLENLAIEYSNLDPTFDANKTQYKAEVSNNTEKLNILAIPNSIYANVNIIGSENISFGENTVKVIVTAENGYTKKSYIIKVYKMTIEEEIRRESEKVQDIKKLKNILDEKKEVNKENNINKNSFKNNKIIKILIVILIVSTVIASYIIMQRYIKKGDNISNKK